MTKRPYDPDRHCGAHPDAPEGPCRLPKGWGTPTPKSGRCRKHGGNTPNGRRFAKTEEARRAVQTYGLPIQVDPAEALLHEVQRTAGHVAWLAEQVKAIDPDALVWGLTKRRAELRTDNPDDDGPGVTVLTEEAAAVSVWLQLYQQERKHLVQVCAAAISAGVEERRVRIAEQHGELLATVIRAVLDDLQLDDRQRALVAEVVPRHLRAVAG